MGDHIRYGTSYVCGCNSILDFVLSRDGTWMVCSLMDGCISVFDLLLGEIVRKIFISSWGICLQLFQKENNMEIFVGCSDGIVHQYDLRSLGYRYSYFGHCEAVNDVIVLDDPAGLRLISSSDDRTLRLWGIGIYRELYIYKVYTGATFGRMISSVHKNICDIFVQSSKGIIRSFAAETSSLKLCDVNLQGHRHNGGKFDMCLIAGGRYLAAGDSDGKCFFWSLSSSRIIRIIKVFSLYCDGICQMKDMEFAICIFSSGCTRVNLLR